VKGLKKKLFRSRRSRRGFAKFGRGFFVLKKKKREKIPHIESVHEESQQSNVELIEIVE
jgi:hypothetical protein